MSNPPPESSGPPPKFWDALPQIISKLRDEFLLVTLGILILVVAIGVFASGVIESLGPAFFYLIVVLAWLAYLIGRVLDLWGRSRPPAPESAESPAQHRPAPAAPAAEPSEHEQLYQALVDHFDREELRTLSFKLGLDYDDLRGEGRRAKAREMVRYMSRRSGELDRLRAAIRAERPGALQE